MPQVKYVGDDGKDTEGKPVGGRNLGRHGWVEKGKVLNLSADEAAMVADDPNFALVPEPKPAAK